MRAGISVGWQRKGRLILLSKFIIVSHSEDTRIRYYCKRDYEKTPGFDLLPHFVIEFKTEGAAKVELERALQVSKSDNPVLEIKKVYSY